MTAPRIDPTEGHDDGGRDPLRSPQLRALAGMIGLECLAFAGLAIFLVIEILTEAPDSYASALGLIVLAAIAAVWLGFMTVGTLRGDSWIRGGAITVQVLLIAVAIGAFQGLVARQDIGWLMLIPAVVILILLFTPPVQRATRRDG